MRGCTGRLPHALGLEARSHAPAFRCAAAASLCTLLAMLGLMLSAFFPACIANLCASVADRSRKFTAPCHVSSCHAAYLRAVHIEPDATHHHLHILFAQA